MTDTAKISDFFCKPAVHFLIIILLGFLVYSATFKVPFVLDDRHVIIENTAVRDIGYFVDPAGISGKRFIGYLTFALNYKLHGLDVTGYHVFNLLVHLINALLVYLLVVFTFNTPWFSGDGLKDITGLRHSRNRMALFTALLFVSHPVQTQAVTYISQRFASLATMFYLLSIVMYIKWRSSNEQRAMSNEQRAMSNESSTMIALFSALLFVSHPIQTQAVTYIVQRFTSLATMFYLLSLVMYIKWRESKEQGAEGREQASNEQGAKSYAPGAMLYAVSIISAVLAMKTKEIAFTLPFVITLYEFTFLNKLPSKTGRLKRFLYLVPVLLTLLIIPLSLVNLDKPLGDAIGELRETSQETEEIPRWSYLITQFRVIVTYLRLFFIPVSQNLDYDYPLYKSFFEPNVFLSFTFLLSIVASCIYLLYAKRYRLHAARLIAFGIFWFFMTLSVESSVIPIRDAINEHRLYLPGIGLIIAFAASVVHAWKFMGQRRRFAVFSSTGPLIIFMTVITIVFSVAAYQRNSVWQDEVKLWEDVARKSPRKTRTHINLGVAYYKQGLLNEAVLEYKTALMLKPDYAIAHNNLGNAYYAQGRTNEAVQEYKAALRLNPSLAETHYNIGNIYMSEGRLNEAAQEYRTALVLNPGYAEAHSSLGFAYYEQGRLNETVQELLAALQLNSYNPDVRNNLGNVYMKLGQIDDAIAHYQAALRLEPNHAITHNNLGLAYKRKGLINEAMQEFQEALRINPGLFQARQNLESLQR